MSISTDLESPTGTTPTTASVRFHLSLNVADLGRSVAFYTRLFGREPAKARADYAKFEVSDPPLVLSLEPRTPAAGGALNHVGFRLESREALVARQRDLERAGISSCREEGVECCYARQTKFWVHDPDGTLWEFYTLDGDIEHRGAGQAAEAFAEPAAPAAVGPGKADGPGHAVGPTDAAASDGPVVWEHTLGRPFPATIDAGDGTVAEVRLRGTFNDRQPAEERRRRLAEVVRVLAPGGRVAVHCLTADRPLSTPPDLPGPASVVTEVPPLAELLAGLAGAGLTAITLTKYGAKPCFTVGEAGLRETRIAAVRPASTPASASAGEPTASIVYRGPFAAVTDDAGRTFRRGEPAAVPAPVLATMTAGPFGDAFTGLAAGGPGPTSCGVPVRPA